MAFEYRLPDVGEGLVEAEIVSWKVEPGDQVAVNDVIVEIETSKSLVELPSPHGGRIGQLLVPEGQVVEVGTPIVSIETETAGAANEPASTAGQGEEDVKTLVGYGPSVSSTARRPRRRSAAASAAAGPAATPAAAATAPSAPASGAGSGSGSRTAVADAPLRQRTAPGSGADGAAAPAAPDPGMPSPPQVRSRIGPVPAKPPVRKLAKDLGIDLAEVPATGPNGTVTRTDLEAFRSSGVVAVGTETGSDTGADLAAAGDLASSGTETRIPIRGVRRTTAKAVTQSAFTAPHVTEWLTVDVSATMELLDRLRSRREFAQSKVTPLLLAAKAVTLALRRTPELNATWDEAAGEIVLKHYVHLGIAVDTPRGLLVPNVRNADRLVLPELAGELARLTSTAREGATQPAEMAGTTFSITNVGVFGVDAGTPILNPGESGILAIGQIDRRPWVVQEGGEEVIRPRWVTTLALSFDHRVVDGAQGSRFLADVAAILRDPALTTLF